LFQYLLEGIKNAEDLISLLKLKGDGVSFEKCLGFLRFMHGIDLYDHGATHVLPTLSTDGKPAKPTPWKKGDLDGIPIYLNYY